MPLTDQALLDYISAHPGAGRENIRRNVAPDLSGPTVWRALKRLKEGGHLTTSGRGRAVGYTLAGVAAVGAHLRQPTRLRKPTVYVREFLDGYIPGKTFYLSEDDRQRLHEAGRPVTPLPAGTYARSILARLLIDLSYASSRMEGNTYDKLQTEELVRQGKEAQGKDKREAIMILNHKEAIQYIVDNLDEVTISRMDMLKIHAMLSGDLLTDRNMVGQLRQTAVGISESTYVPLDNQYSIDEEFTVIIEKASSIEDPFEQSFFLLVHIPYLQAFADVNKRTSRIASNIPLLKAGLAPMSFLTIDDSAYIDGLIGVYELNNVSLLRDVFIEGYLASSESYKTIRAELENPSIAALLYRDFVREAVRRCVLDWHEVRRSDIIAMAAEAGIPDTDHDEVAQYINDEFHGLHEGNAIRYRLKPSDLSLIRN